MINKISYILLFLGIAFLMRLYNLGINSQKMKASGLSPSYQSLVNCTSDMNCVSGFSQVENNKIQEIVKFLSNKSNFEVKKVDSNYLYFTDKSSIFGFVDDIEFLYDESLKKLHYKSSSRVGKSDLGANKKRIDRILTEIGL